MTARKPAQGTVTVIPGGAKKPQDRKPKAAAKPKPEVERTDDSITVTHRGVTIRLDAEAFNDFELVEAIEGLGRGDESKLPTLLRSVAGDQYEAVKKLCRDSKSGRVLLRGPGSVEEFLVEVMEAANPPS